MRWELGSRVTSSVLFALFPLLVGVTRAQSTDWCSVVQDDFEGGVLDADTWWITSANDIRERFVGVAAREDGHALRFGADTVGTEDTSVKHLGVVHVSPLDLAFDHDISLTLDWNDQANGSYLTAGVFLAPELTQSAAEDLASWIKVEYVGVPPGKNSRALVARRDDGQLSMLETEGWPESRTGRRIGRVHLQIRIAADGRLQVSENGNALYISRERVVRFRTAYLYLQMSSHSNYRMRDLFFDDVSVRRRQALGRAHLPHLRSRPLDLQTVAK